MSKLQKIKNYVIQKNYRISEHAQQELDADNLTQEDVENIILTGQIVKKYTHDPRGTRYLINGNSRDGRICYIVCRFLETGRLGIVTGYNERSKHYENNK